MRGAGRNPRLHLAGLAEIHRRITFWVSPRVEFGEFEFFEMGINFMTSVTDDLRIGAQFFTRDLGPIGNSVITLDWAFADYSIIDEFNIRAGRMKQSYGLRRIRTLIWFDRQLFFQTPST